MADDHASSAPVSHPIPSPDRTEWTANDELIEHLARRFCAWRLPQDFAPDNGISYRRPNYAPEIDATPTGTNLLTVAQAEAMFRELLSDAALSRTSTGANDGQG